MVSSLTQSPFSVLTHRLARSHSIRYTFLSRPLAERAYPSMSQLARPSSRSSRDGNYQSGSGNAVEQWFSGGRRLGTHNHLHQTRRRVRHQYRPGSRRFGKEQHGAELFHRCESHLNCDHMQSTRVDHQYITIALGQAAVFLIRLHSAQHDIPVDRAVVAHYLKTAIGLLEDTDMSETRNSTYVGKVCRDLSRVAGIDIPPRNGVTEE